METLNFGQKNIFDSGPLTVTKLIEEINKRLKPFEAKVIGEIGRVDEKNGHRYFSLKDEVNGNVLNCIIWRSRYEMFGIKLSEGMKIIASGHAEVYSANGRLSFICNTVELTGEGALKKAYDALLKKLTAEGLFDIERKRRVPQFCQRIGVITSKQGAVIHDFLTNIGKFGFRIEMIDSRVEGQMAVNDLLASIRSFKKRDIQVLVIMRGGGSPESMQAFNNEMIVREIAAFPVPVIAAIGHDKDVPLVSMAADVAVSTPTEAAHRVSDSWQKIVQLLNQQEVIIIGGYKNILAQTAAVLSQRASILGNFKYILQNILRLLDSQMAAVIAAAKSQFQATANKIDHLNDLIQTNNPERQLKLGYSVAKLNGKTLKSCQNAAIDKALDIILCDGIISSKITNIKTYEREKED